MLDLVYYQLSPLLLPGFAAEETFLYFVGVKSFILYAFCFPLNLDFCISIGENTPFIKLTAVCDRVYIAFSSAMSECLRNFFEYYKNVGL